MQSRVPKCKVVVIDNYDSFTYNLVEVFQRLGCKTEVWRNEIHVDIALARLLADPTPSMLVISPGPGSPKDAGNCIELIRAATSRVPIMGICLGHQAIVEAFGGAVGRAPKVVHGKTSPVKHGGTGVFQTIDSPMTVGRYHSLSALCIPNLLEETASFEGVNMAVEHKLAPVLGFQFHPESILTPRGDQLIENVIEWANNWWLNAALHIETSHSSAACASHA